MVELNEGDVVMCVVRKVEGTTVFLHVENDGDGTMSFSEVSAGRIRNLREYVSVGRRIVCKVLRISKGHTELSLRRVTSGERDAVLEKHKKEGTLRSILKSSVDGFEKVLEKIKKEFDISEFFEKIKEDAKILEKFLSKEAAAKVAKIFAEKEGKEKVVARKFILKSDSPSGVVDIRKILEFDDVEIHYLGSSNFSIFVKGKDFKIAEKRLEEVLGEIEKRARARKAVFEMGKEKK